MSNILLSWDLADLYLVGVALKKRLKTACLGMALHQRLFLDFSEDIQPEHIEEWTSLVEKWEADTDEPDPYFVAPSGTLSAALM